MHRLRATYLFAAAAALIVWSVGCSVFYRHLTDRWNHAQLSEMTSQALERAERALDLVVLTQTEVLIAGLALCGPEAVEQLRRSKYGVGHVADMYLLEPGVRARHCSAGGAFSASLPPATVRSAWPTGSNPDLRMGTFEGRDGPVLGVEWRPGGARSIIAAIDADALLFDVLPGALRERAGLALKIEGGDVFARFALTSGGAANEAGWTEFTSESVRYPISAELRVAPDALADWRAQPGEMTIAVAILVGLLVSLLCAEAIHRRIDPKSEAIDK
ncbi:MAG: CSS-motif domain-containing protein, partial [Pseudomonadota bacterium]